MSAKPKRSSEPTRPAQPRPAPRVVLFPRRELWLTVGVALALRLLYWALYSRTPFFRHPVIDGSFFDLWAQALASGQNAGHDVWFKPPLYAYWLSLVYRLFGHAPLVAYALQTVMGLATAALVLAVGRLVFTPRIALAGALIAGLLPILPFLELQLVAESLTTLLAVAAVLALLLARRDDGWGEKWLVFAGLLLGLAVIGRPNVLLFVPLAAWWVWQAAAGARAARLRPAAIFLAGAFITLVPTTLRNYGAGHSLVPVSANFGVNLWSGVAPGADGVSAVPVGTHWDDLLLRSQVAGATTPTAGSAYYTRLALHEMAAAPLRTAGLLAKKVLVLAGAPEIRNNIGPSFLASEYGVVTLARWWPGFWLVAPFALLGLAGGRRWGLGGRLLAYYLLAQALSILPFFINARFRAPMLPLLALFAAAGADALFVAWRAGDRRQLTRLLAGGLVFALVVLVPWFPADRARDDARDHYNLAMAYSARLTGQGKGAGGDDWRAQDPVQARAHFDRAIALDPGEADYCEGLGQFLMQLATPAVTRAQDARERGDAAQAVAAFAPVEPMIEQAAELHRRAAQLFPRSFRSWANLGFAESLLAEATSGEAAVAYYRQAVADCEAALRLAPHYQPASDNLAVVKQRLATLGVN
jgi:4-amino-4-deoxy-L-arabinose transferase-like glycosyltransferase